MSDSGVPRAGDVVFVYGSLMFARVWLGVTGQPWLAAVPAEALGWRRHALRGRDYPGLRPDSRARVKGLCVFGVSPGAMARLDAFEGEPYERTVLRASLLADGPDGWRRSAELDAYAYVFRDAGVCLDAPWEPEAFERDLLAGFLARHGL